MKSKKIYQIWTDGACLENPGPGAWGAYILRMKGPKQEKIGECSGKDPDTTNNRMEMMAAIDGLRSLEERCNVTIFTDSKYLINGITKWIHKWKKKNWITTKNTNVLNKDLWIELEKQCRIRSVSWKWVKGHSGIYWNEMADRLAEGGLPSSKRLKRAKAS